MSFLASLVTKILELCFSKLIRWWQARARRLEQERELKQAREKHDASTDKPTDEQEQAARDLINASRRKS